jgi:hypothetical protein
MRRKGREFLSWGLRKKGTKKGTRNLVALDSIRLQLASLDVGIFANGIMESAHISHASMAMGSVSIDDHACTIFED